MNKWRLIKIALCIVVAHVTSLAASAQVGVDILSWYVGRYAYADTNAVRHRIQNISVIQKDSTGERLVTNKFYNDKGYLIRRVDYTQANELDSMETIVKRDGSNKTVVTFTFRPRGDYSRDDEGGPSPYLGVYFDSISTESYSTLTKVYESLPADSVSVITSLNGVIKGDSGFVLMKSEKGPYGLPEDTSYISDTLVVSRQEKDSLGNSFESRSSFIKGIWGPVKIEEKGFTGDKLVYHLLEINEYDNKKRLVNHALYQGPPIQQWECKIITYTKTGERTETSAQRPDYFPKHTWRYDKKGRMVYAEKLYVDGVKSSSVFKYNKKGMLEEKIHLLNGVPELYVNYKYGYRFF